MTTSTYKTTRTTRVTRTDDKPRATPASTGNAGTFSLTMRRPGVLEITGLDPIKLAERLPHVVRLLTR